MAVTQGARASIEKSVGKLAANSVDVWRGKGWGDDLAGSITTLTPSDIEALMQLPFVTSVSPQANSDMRLRRRQKDVKGQAIGASAHGVAINNVHVDKGRDLNQDDVSQARLVAVIGDGARKKLFDDEEDPLGQQILVGEVPFVIVGVAAKNTGGIQFSWDGGETAWVPYTTALTRLLGRNYFDGLHVHLRPDVPPAVAEKRVSELIERTHGKKDFNVQNRASEWQEFSNVTLVFSMVMGLIAAISLFVGGVGVMNIMLVAVAERTQEIGIRVAVGARPADIARQFLIEAVTLCVVGGVIGVALAALLCLGVSLATDKIQPAISLASVLAAFGTCSAIGVIFGWLPARRAARLDPVVALARE
jgi:macrolide transport system ATP-binding/permease protein